MDSSREATSGIGRARVLGPIPELGRNRRAAAAVIMMSAGLFIAIPLSAVLPTGADFTALTMRGGSLTGFVVLLLYTAMLVAAITSRNAIAISIALLVFLVSFTAAASSLIARFVTPTPFTLIYMIIPVAYLAVVLSVPTLRNSLGWLRVGESSPFLSTALAVLAILSVVGLILYFVTIRPDLGPVCPMGMQTTAATHWAPRSRANWKCGTADRVETSISLRQSRSQRGGAHGEIKR